MKYGFLLLIASFPALAFAQKPEQDPDALVFKRAREVVDSFIRSTFGIENGVVDLIAYNQLKNWFDVNATVQDDFNAVYYYDTKGKKGTYIIKKDAKPFDRYAHDVALQVKQLVIDAAGEIVPVDTLNKRRLVYEIFRKVSVWKDRKYVLPARMEDSILRNRQDIDFDNSRDFAIKALQDKIRDTATYFFTTTATLRITLISNEAGMVKISHIESNFNQDSVVCINDMDKDAVPDRDDILPNVAGDFTSNGRPDYDLDGVPDAGKEVPVKIADRCRKTYGKVGNQGCPMDYFLTRRTIDGFVGVQMNSAPITLSALNRLGYSATDVLQSKMGSLKNPGLRAGIYAGGSYTYYAGRVERDIGVSIGVNFTAFFADYQLNEPVMYTFKAFDSINDYRRRVTIDSLSESIRYNIFNFPIMFAARWYFGKKDPLGIKQRKSVMNIKAGPSLMVFNTTSEYDAFISFEGLYQTDENGIIYKEPFADNDTYNVFFTADSIFAQNPGRRAEDVFRELRNNNSNYDFADSKNFRGKQKNESRLTVGFNLDINLQRQISTEWDFKVGLQAVYAPLPESKDKYIPINKTTDTFNSIYNSGAKSSYTAFGLHAGLVYKF